jgi:hypothetical protein
VAIDAFHNREIEPAIEWLNRAERDGYDADRCAGYRWMCWMLLGRFREAWRESEAIAARGGTDPHRFWDGRGFAGKRVLIRCLHGLGDTIQFSRYARLVRHEARHVTVQTHPQLVSLMRGIADEAITWPDPPGLKWDQQIEVMELPRAFQTTLETIPCATPYLQVEQERLRGCRMPRVRDGRPRIGLQWGSGEWNASRSVALAQLRPVFEMRGAEFYSFQRGAEREELTGFDAGCELRDVSGECTEIVEAAADLMHTDLLITVDTMLAHLAGALGRPVWVMLPWDADWRWMLEREDSPWYPTMRLFRQDARSDWDSTVRKVSQALSAWLRR